MPKTSTKSAKLKDQEERLAPPAGTSKTAQTDDDESSNEERLTPPGEGKPAENNKNEDYLRPYQYRKNTVPGSVASDPPPGSKAERQKLWLLTQPRRPFFIPLLQGESELVPQSITRNDYRLDIPKNTWIDLPDVICEQLQESLKQTHKALAHKKLDDERSELQR